MGYEVWLWMPMAEQHLCLGQKFDDKAKAIEKLKGSHTSGYVLDLVTGKVVYEV